MITTLPICRLCGQQKSAQEAGRLVCRPCMREKAARKRRKFTCLPCATCGLAKTPRTDGFMICRPCVRAAATKAETRTPTDLREPTAWETLDAVCELHNIGMTVPQMHPNAGRLKAGQSLYPRREVTV